VDLNDIEETTKKNKQKYNYKEDVRIKNLMQSPSFIEQKRKLALYSSQVSWKNFEDRVRVVILDILNPFQIKIDSITTNAKE
jgi:hypothetical protein